MKPTWESGDVQLYLGDCLEILLAMNELERLQIENERLIEVLQAWDRAEQMRLHNRITFGKSHKGQQVNAAFNTAALMTIDVLTEATLSDTANNGDEFDLEAFGGLIIAVAMASHKKLVAGLRYAASGEYQDYEPGVLELGVALDALNMMLIDITDCARDIGSVNSLEQYGTRTGLEGTA